PRLFVGTDGRRVDHAAGGGAVVGVRALMCVWVRLRFVVRRLVGGRGLEGGGELVRGGELVSVRWMGG
ncbi:hypothetical protein, partial [Nocardia farcinica]|uniref:hypothetical protein n=1 Tax=Nocardia farcinica TaxID=37329 RepID=UPI002454A0AD